MKKNMYHQLLCLLAAVLLCLTACGQTAASPEGIPDKEEIGKIESLYGKAAEDVEKGMNLSEKDYTVNEADSTWDLTAKRTMGGQEFTQLLLFTYGDSATLYGVMYEAVVEDGIDTGILEALYKEAAAAYGEPGTYPGLSNTISGNLLKEDGSVAELGEDNMYQEQWSVGSQTGLTMRVIVSGGKMVAIRLNYQMAAES